MEHLYTHCPDVIVKIIIQYCGFQGIIVREYEAMMRVYGTAVMDGDIITCQDGGMIQSFNMITGQCDDISTRGKRVTAILKTEDAYITSDLDGNIRLWHGKTYTNLWKFNQGIRGLCWMDRDIFAWSVDVVYQIRYNSKTSQYDTVSEIITALRGREIHTFIPITPTDLLFNMDSSLHVFTSAGVVKLQQHTDFITCSATLNQRQVATGSNDCTVRVWDVKTWKVMHMLYHNDWVTAVLGLPDGRLVSGTSMGAMYIWDLGTLKSTIIQAHRNLITSLTLHNDTGIISTSLDTMVKLWR